MSKKKAAASGGGGTMGPAPSPTSSLRSTRPLSTPHRPVVSLALVLFVPALWLVLDGNLSVQTALLRFIGALFVSWLAARLVLATVSSFAASARTAQAAAAAAPPTAADSSGLSGTSGAPSALSPPGAPSAPDTSGATGPTGPSGLRRRTD